MLLHDWGQVSHSRHVRDVRAANTGCHFATWGKSATVDTYVTSGRPTRAATSRLGASQPQSTRTCSRAANTGCHLATGAKSTSRLVRDVKAANTGCHLATGDKSSHSRHVRDVRAANTGCHFATGGKSTHTRRQGGQHGLPFRDW